MNASVTSAITSGIFSSSISRSRKLFDLADRAFHIPVEIAHLVAAPGLAAVDADHAGVVGDRSGERIEALSDLVAGFRHKGTDVGWHRSPERRHRHHALAEPQPDH